MSLPGNIHFYRNLDALSKINDAKGYTVIGQQEKTAAFVEYFRSDHIDSNIMHMDKPTLGLCT